MEQAFDLVVIGTGVAASTVAQRCRAAGWTVAIIDEQPYGGTCALRGCDPKKLLRRGPEILDAARLMDGKGVVPEGLRLDWPALVAHKRAFTDPIPSQRERGFAESGIATFHGTARFVDGHTLMLGPGEERLRGRHLVIASGARPRPLDIPGEPLVTTSSEFMELDALPRRILFIGGGYISFEFAHMAARAGASVTLLNRGDRVLEGFDPDLVERLVERSTRVGIALHRRAEVEAIEQAGEALEALAKIESEPQRFEADLVVHGAGRVPAVEALDLEKGGIEAGKRGVEVNEYLQSVSNPAVYAAGDAAAGGGPPLTPVANLEGEVVAENLLQGNCRRPDYSGVPSVVFTIPALARVGLLEEEARDQGLDVACKLTDMSGWYSSRRVGETHAAAKTLVEKGSGRVLGAHLLGPESGETINLFALAIRSGLRASDLKGFVSAYPSAASDIGSLL